MQNHALSDTEKLLLIKASAGSGKTHRLTGEYLRLLFSAEGQYKHILAVTFTNKATDEMKTRIVDELYTLSIGENSDYLIGLMNGYNLSEIQIRAKAKDILENILHDFSSFSISTIDKFFQQTMRAFTRELGLSGGYRLELDDNFVLLQIIDLMIFELDKPQNMMLSGWILDYMKHQISEGKSWNIRENIGNLARQLSNEKYKLLSNESSANFEDKEILKEYRNSLLKIINAWENEVKTTARHALQIMEKYNLNSDDFKHGRNSSFSSFVKMANGDLANKPSARFYSRPDNLEDWFNIKSPKRTEIEKSYNNGLNDCFKIIINMYNNRLDYLSAKSIMQNYYTLGILSDVRRRLRLFQKENNTLFLSDTTELLNKIIADSDAPFVYEKTGTRIINYMIDEFQDTSLMQWRNFKPLLSESLANGRFNLIVGDVKQSIYRWRNSDWGLLENQITRDFGKDAILEEILDTNWRSDANIVNFNNTVFHIAAQLLQTDFNSSTETEDRRILGAYQHVWQNVPEKRKKDEGHVKITFIDTTDKEKSWTERAFERLPKEIEKLQDQGFALKDIAILVRKNDEAIEIAESLLKYKELNPNSKYRYDIISNEALVIGNAQGVKAVIALLRHFQNRQDETKLMLSVYEFYRFHGNLTPEGAINIFFDNNLNDYPQEIKAELNRISNLSLYEMVEAFFSMRNNCLDEKENAYIQAFLDIVLKFSAETSSNANDFLEWWDEKGHKKTLFSPDDQDAIRLMTIHKSKGLGFNAVILPFLKWEIDHAPTRGPVLWCKPMSEPFNMLKTVPLIYNKKLIETIFKEDYLEEKLYTYIDNLNLLYVAFTRAKKQICAFAPKPSNDGVGDVSSLLWQTIHHNGENPHFLLSNYLREDDMDVIFELGVPTELSKKTDIGKTEKLNLGAWHSIPFNNRLSLKLNSIGFFSDDGSRAYGTLLHEIVSKIETIDDLDKTVEAKYIAGEVDFENKTKIKKMLTSVITDQIIAEWYSGKYHVINETQVLHPSFGFSRPDRVMIGDNEVIVVDYKFGETETEKYIKQVRHYVRLIKEMGYENVKGIIFYVNSGIKYEV